MWFMLEMLIFFMSLHQQRVKLCVHFFELRIDMRGVFDVTLLVGDSISLPNICERKILTMKLAKKNANLISYRMV